MEWFKENKVSSLDFQSFQRVAGVIKIREFELLEINRTRYFIILLDPWRYRKGPIK